MKGPHRHCEVVRLPDGTEITAASFHPADPYDRDPVPGSALYFDHLWQPPWPHEHLDWPDFGLPDPGAALRTLRTVLAKARSGERVEIGCIGGHGRTGTALACLAYLAGLEPSRAVAWVRSTYCMEAIETTPQERFVYVVESEASSS